LGVLGFWDSQAAKGDGFPFVNFTVL
jgi:hypothetical protein